VSAHTVLARPLPDASGMPGVFGWIDLGHDHAGDAADGAALLGEMARRMSHSGREQVDTWTDPGGRFAVGRVTLDGAAVPWAASPVELGPELGTERVFLEGALHGEPAQVAERLRDLARLGRTALPSLRGSFTLACWAPAARRLTLAVDRRASRPLAYARVGSRLYFAPEVKAILAAPGVDKSVDEAAVGLFLGAGYVLGPQTLFASIRRLGGGEVLVAEPGRIHVEAYWSYRLSERGDGTRPRDLEEELGSIVRAAVERDAGEPDRTIVFLSGGVDSRSIAGVAQEAARRQGKQARTVTWASPETRPRSDRDVAHAVARALGTRHQSVVRQVSAWGRRLTGVTYLLDGLTDVPAFHPHEHVVMRDLVAGGAVAVLRGDECFGWEGPVASLEDAWLSLNLRSPRLLRHAGGVVRAPTGARLAAAAEAALAEAGRPFEGEHPDNAKDLLYFRHRLQSYLGSAAYLKQVVLDHRAPLVDEAVLDFNARVPAALRAHKGLFCRAAARLAPELFAIPLARRGNLEDWGLLLSCRSPVRRHVEAELADRESGIWELFDRDALLAGLPPIGPSPETAPSARLTRAAKTVAHAALHLAPSVERRVLTRSHRAGLRFEQLCLRVLVLKAWHDLFVRGDGSRRALEERLARVE
jgi:Asparagine synthase/Glutamine amidotransferase domain